MQQRIFILVVALTTITLHAKSTFDMVNLKTVIPSAHFDIRYATTRNFLGKPIYTQPACYLRRGTATKLAKVQKDLLKVNLSLKIWDAYRPHRIQQLFWDSVAPEMRRFFANPKLGSNHGRGAAVDITLVDAQGNELDFGTDHDDFTSRAFLNTHDISVKAQQNRSFLITIMTKHGFKVLPHEWWHFNDTQAAQYDVLDVPFEELKN